MCAQGIEEQQLKEVELSLPEDAEQEQPELDIGWRQLRREAIGTWWGGRRSSLGTEKRKTM